jgi:formate-dependent nitrite reductase membrane component NrfD
MEIGIFRPTNIQQKMTQPLFTNDAIILGLLITVLALVFVTSDSEKPGWKKFYTYVPPLLLCH